MVTDWPENNDIRKVVAFSDESSVLGMVHCRRK